MAIKTIILVRHGQYKKEPKEVLTLLGRKQAKLTGKRLKEISFQAFHHSTMPRARETAEIMSQTIGYKKPLFGSDLLHECVPSFPKELRKKYGFTDEKRLRIDKRRADRAFKELFTFSNKNRVELVVCHGNIIRYFICKALGVHSEAWTRFDIKQCGISEIELDSEYKTIKIISHNDVGHIPIKMQTFI